MLCQQVELFQHHIKLRQQLLQVQTESCLCIWGLCSCQEKSG